MNLRAGLFLIFTVAAGALSFPVSVRADEEVMEEFDSAYSFPENLLGAETLIRYHLKQQKKKSEFKGRWKKDHFDFNPIGQEADMRVLSLKIDDEKEKVISFRPLAKALRRIRFQAVPPGGTLLLIYKIDRKNQARQADYFYFQIWAGTHMLKRVRIASNQTEWQKLKLDLGVISFLSRELSFTFELDADEAGEDKFLLLADILP